MMEVRCRGRAWHLLVLAVIAVMLQGCAVARYFQYRVQDAMDIVEVGVSVSTTPQLALYWNSLDLAVFGYSNFDGYLIGLGGRHPGVTRLHEKCYGLIVSHEEVAWGPYDADHPEALRTRIGGLAGLPGLVFGTKTLDSPSCVHFFPHIGYVGLVWDLRWGQILDFIVGWTTIDLGHDDGPQPEDTAPKQEIAPAEPAGHRAHAEPAAQPTRAAEPPAPTSDAGDSGKAAVSEPAPAPSYPPAAQRVHVVLQGESVFSISRKYYGTGAKWRVIMDANKSVLSDVRKLQPGMKLVIPGQ
jgi:LysM repeat protein